jgi:hypothetical protein
VKLVLASRAKGPSNRSEAWACVTANIALPGSGSLAAAKPIGYFQLGVAFTGVLITTIAGGRLAVWMTGHAAALSQPSDDPFQTLATLWRQLEWPLVGFGVFGLAWLWAAVTSLQILSAHPKNPVPPRIV